MSESKLPSIEPRSGLFGRLEWRFPLILIVIYGLLVPVLYKFGLYGIDDVNMWGRYMCFAMIAVGLDLVWGYTGMLSLCQALFFSLGGYAMGMYLAHHGGPEGAVDAAGWKIPGCLFVVYPGKVGETQADWLVPWFWKPFWWLSWTVLLGILIPSLVAFLVGFFVFRSRVRGVFFAILTQALTVMAMSVFMVNDMKLGGTNGVTRFNRIVFGGRERIEIVLKEDELAKASLTFADIKSVLEKRRTEKRRDGEVPAPGGSLEESEENILLSSPAKGVNINQDYKDLVVSKAGDPKVTLKDVAELRFRGFNLTDDSVKFCLYIVTLALLILVYLLCRYVVSSRMGRVLVAIRDNEDRLRFSGFKPYRYKVVVYAFAAGIAGLGGLLYAPQMGIFTPHNMRPIESILVVVWVAVGGRGSLWGAVTGALVVNYGYNFLTSRYPDYWMFVLAAVFLLIVLLAPGGIASLLKWVSRSLRSGTGDGGPAAGPEDMDDRSAGAAEEEMSKRLQRIKLLSSVKQEVDVGRDLLEVRDITVLFDGFKALDVKQLAVGHRELKVIIGPNGAGKTTLCDVISGKTRPTTGQVFFEGTDITLAPEADIAQLGVGRKFQTPTVYDSLTVYENMTLALPGRQGISLGSRITDDERTSIRSQLERVRLLDDEHREVEYLSHGQRQWLEISMLILTGPKLLLVDEPAAGLTDEETVLTAELLLECREEHSIIVIEHDMEFVRLLDSHVTVLNEGKIMAEGSVAEVQANEEVREAYLGR
ncbi:MAG: urea ABC transporter ATP-binding protein UrtD [Planctomycetota bacterium]|nr:urea ABC transporter ATP-binding protein UrtD [Planctomycetota bacterium]